MSKVNEALTVVTLEAKDLPAYCPHVTMPVWSSHPKVYLDFAANGQAKCPYCGTVYQMAPGTKARAH